MKTEHKRVAAILHPSARDRSITTDASAEELGSWFREALAALRIAFGLTFLWAFFDKLLALGFHTGYAPDGTLDRFGDAAWVNGGSPTEGFLTFAADGPFKSLYNDLAGLAVVDWLFMLSLLGIGVALTFGIGMRVFGTVGAILYLLMWTAVLPPENNPVLDEHILGALSMIVLVLGNAGHTWGLGRIWERTSLVEANPILR